MITELNAVPGQASRLILKPNNSMSWRGNLYVLLTLIVLSLCIGLFFMLMGVWVVFPFLLLEALLLFSVFYSLARQLRYTEVISVDTQHVVVEKGSDHPEQLWDFQRQKVVVVVHHSDEPLRRDKISLSGDQGVVVLGEFLNNEDSRSLLNALQRCGLRTMQHETFVIREF